MTRQRGSSTQPPDEVADPDDDGAFEPDDETRPDAPTGPGLPDLSALPVAGITRRRVGFLVAALLSAWVVIVFAGQVGDASSAGVRVEQLRRHNDDLAGRVGALEREHELIQRQAWIVQQARGHGLGAPGEQAFAISEAPPLPPDAPGSAAVRLGAGDEGPSPLEAWLSLLFGPER